MVVNSEWAQVEAIELENDGSGLAFGIIGGRSTGVVVKTILPGGVADRDGRLQSGDHILRIGEVSMRGLGCEQAAAVLRQCGVRVRLLVARAADPTAEFRSLGASNAPIVPTKVLGDPDELDRALLDAGYTEGLPPPSPAPLVDRYEDRYVYHRGGVDLELLPISVVDVVRSGAPLPPLAPPVRRAPPPAPDPPATPLLPLDAALRGGPAAPEVETFSVSLSKDVYGLGITVAGYVCEEEELSGIFVKSISTGSSADLCNKIQINDRIIEVDGQPLQSVSNHQAVELLRCTGSNVKLKLERFLRGPRYERLQKALKVQGVGAGPPSPSVSSLPACPVTMYEESSVIEPEMESRATIDYPPPGSPVSMGAPECLASSSPSEDREIVIGREPKGDGSALRAIQDKWREILSLEPDGDIDDLEVVVGTMMKEPGGGLGISLEGTVEVRGGREVRPHHYIRSILHDGPVGRSGQLRAGDELLEVNGRRLLGLHHLEVVRALKQLPASVCLVCARRPGRRTLIDTAQHRAAFAARNILGGSLQNLLPPPERMIKAKSESSITSACSTNATIASTILGNPSLKSRSRSLEPMSGLAMWSDQPEYIELVKGDRGLGFSILDYQDPVEPKGTVIVVRSVVPGGAAARSGKLRPGDRLLSVNGMPLAGASLAQAVQSLKAAPKGIVRIGVAKPLPSSSLGSADKNKRNNDSISSQDGVNSAGSDDHTGFDSYHECLQEYQECLEVVQICLEPEDSSLREDDMSNLEDFSFEEIKNDSINDSKNGVHKLKNGEKKMEIINNEFYNVRDLISDNLKYNGNQCEKYNDLRKSDDSLDGNDEDMTITEDDPEKITKIVNASNKTQNGIHNISKNDVTSIRRKSLTSGHNRDLSTSDEMVFAVTPTGLERISYEKYWKDVDLEESSKDSEKHVNLDSIRSDESWKDCNSIVATPNDTMQDIADVNAIKSMRSAFENSLQYIDHDVEGYDTCLEDDSFSIKADDTIINNNMEISDSDRSDKIYNKSNEDNSIKDDKDTVKLDSQKNIEPSAQNVVDSKIDDSKTNKVNDVNMLNKKNEIDTLNIVCNSVNNLQNDKRSMNNIVNNNTEKKTEEVTKEIVVEVQQQGKTPEKSKKKIHRIKVVEYYNDQAECLEEYMRQKKIEEEKKKQKDVIETKAKVSNKEKKSIAFRENIEKYDKTTVKHTNVVPTVFPGCHKCYLEHYMYGITKAFSDVSKCKVCAVVKAMLEPPRRLPKRCRSSPAIMDPSCRRRRPSKAQTTQTLLGVPQGQDRRRSAGPLYFYPEESIVTHKEVPKQELEMTVSLDKYSSPSHDVSALDKHWGRPRKVVVNRVPNSSIGISIVGGKVDITNSNNAESGKDVVISGIFIKNVVPNSPAGQCGELRTGDRILEVDGTDVRTASHEKAVQIIRAAGESVTFLVQSLLPWNTDSSDVESLKVVNSLTDTVSGSPTTKPGPAPTSPPLQTQQTSIKTLALINKIINPPDETDNKTSETNNSAKAISAIKAASIVASLTERQPLNPSSRETALVPFTGVLIPPLIAKPSLPDTPILQSSPLKKNHDVPTTTTTLSPTSSLKKERAPDPPRITPEFEVTDTDAPPLPEKPRSRAGTPGSAKFDREATLSLPPPSPMKLASPAKGILINSPSRSEKGLAPSPGTSGTVTPTSSKPLPPPPPEVKEKVVYSDDEDSDEDDDDEEDRRDLEGRTYTTQGVEIDRASAGNVKRTKEEKEADPEEEDSFGYTTNKVKKKYSNLGESIVCVQLERGSSGLGISLAGHRDRSRMAVFVCGLRPGGVASKTGGVHVGDEILEVNGIVLHGRCHLNASAIIKGLAGPIFKVILLRRSQALEDVAVKPITQFPVSLEEETDESRYAAYKNVRSVTIKKGTQSLGIMIIEGRHAEVGQGIFISDIQEGSAAEQAGLAIGDMILAVNKDTLLGSNYDTAASMLKKTEGVVVLLVCNPNKKNEDGSAPSEGTTTEPSRAQTPARAPTPGGLKGPPSAHVSRPNTPAGKLSLASPAKPEPMADPATAAIIPGKETIIDITTESKPLGIHVIGGQDTLLPGGMVILEVYPDGKAAKDGRLKPGDQILDCNGVKITPEMKNEKALSLIKQTVPRMKMVVLRPETMNYQEIDVDLIKKPGKGIGLTIMAKKPPPGVYISELVHGGTAELDGRLQKGDVILSVNGQNVKESTYEEAAAALKCAQAKVSLKVGRHKLAR